MPVMLQTANPLVKQQISNLRNDAISRVPHNENMRDPDEIDRRLGNNLKAWREFRRLTQAQLAEKIGTSPAVVSLLESGDRKLSPKWLFRIAPALNVRAGHLLDHDPNDLPTDMLEIWTDVPDEDRPRALKVLEAFRKTGNAA